MEGPCTFGPLNFMNNSAGGQVGLSKEDSEEAEVVCGRQAVLTQPRVEWRGAEPPQARV